MGAVIGVSIATCILNTYVDKQLRGSLSPTQIETLLQSSAAIYLLPPNLQTFTRLVFAEGYNLQIKVLIGFSAAQIPAALLMWEKTPLILGT